MAKKLKVLYKKSTIMLKEDEEMKALFTFPIQNTYKEHLIETYKEIEWYVGEITDAIYKEAEIVITYGEDLNEDILAKGKNLKWLSVASAGLERMPLRAISERNLLVTNAKGIHRKPMTESIFAHVLSYKRNLPQIYLQQQEKQWNRKVPQTELNGTTTVILGAGAIGSEVARLFQAFGVTTIGVNSSGEMVENFDRTVSIDQLLTVLPEADIVLSLLPSTAKTKYLLKQEHFEKMKKTAIFMNFGRGDIMEENVFIEAIRNEEIAHAVLDVYEEEPLHEGHPFWDLPNVVLSPHVSSHSSQYIPRAMEIFEHNLREWLSSGTNYWNKIDVKKGY